MMDGVLRQRLEALAKLYQETSEKQRESSDDQLRLAFLVGKINRLLPEPMVLAKFENGLEFLVKDIEGEIKPVGGFVYPKQVPPAKDVQTIHSNERSELKLPVPKDDAQHEHRIYLKGERVFLSEVEPKQQYLVHTIITQTPEDRQKILVNRLEEAYKKAATTMKAEQGIDASKAL